MAARRHPGGASTPLATTATVAVVVLASFALGIFSLRGGETGVIATRIAAAAMAAVLLFHAVLCTRYGCRMLRARTAWAGVLWMLVALVQSLLALLALTDAFPLR